MVLTQRHKGTKSFSGNKENKRLKSRHKALRMENFAAEAPPNPPRGTCIAADNSVSSVKAALAALCIFRTRKKSQCLCVSVFKKNLRKIKLLILNF